MAKNTPKPHTVETILELIETFLSPAQKRELGEKLLGQSGEEFAGYTAYGMLLAREEMRVESLKEDLNDADAEIRNRIPKRVMSKARIETAIAYLALRQKHSKEISALHGLVSLPSERVKSYAKKYQSSKNEEQLRQYVKSLLQTYSKHQAK